MNETPLRMTLSQRHYQAMLAQVQANAPEEACGLLGGRLEGGEAQVETVLPVENALHSPFRFRMAPEAQLQGFHRLEAEGLELVAIFHSHPTGPDHPSPTDLEEFAYPGVVSVIWYPDVRGWQFRGFSLDNRKVREVVIVLE